MRWPPYPIVVYDCDSTLSTIEGIDVLADQVGLASEVAALTDAAMDGDVDLSDVYGERLSMLNPTRQQVLALKDDYKTNVVADAGAVIAALSAVGHEQWIVSGGLLEPVVEFGIWLGIEADRIRAVGTEFDPLAGSWWTGTKLDARYLDYTAGHLTETTGKGDVIDAAIVTPGRRLMIGDGMSDLRAATSVDLFVAYAGVVARDAVVESAPVVVRSKSLAPILALAIGPERVKELVGSEHSEVALRCFEAIDDGAVVFNDPDRGAAFRRHFNTREKAARCSRFWYQTNLVNRAWMFWRRQPTSISTCGPVYQKPSSSKLFPDTMR